jgi:ribose 5-phosphate isomerase B
MTIFIGSDHRGVTLKKQIIDSLTEDGFNVLDTKLENNEHDDYPDFAFEVGENVVKTKDSLGILICGNGIGISIAANKVKGIRCARVLSEDDAFKSKNHNGANIIAIGADIDLDNALKFINVFISTKAATEERHLNRINKIIKYESDKYNEL